MDVIRVVGGQRLAGEIHISGAKNSVLKLMCAALLTDMPVKITNVPNLQDINSLAELLRSLGCRMEFSGASTVEGSRNRAVEINAGKVNELKAHYDYVRKMRASILVLGPLLARFRKASVSLPGGCAIGMRPVDLHIQAFRAMGAQVELINGYIEASAPKGLKGAEIEFEKVSVGATENALMAATLADGITILKNAACEPEIVDLATLLNKMGAKIEGHGTCTITITGVNKLHGAEHATMGDRIEAGTYLVAAAISGGKLRIRNIDSNLLKSLVTVIEHSGSSVIMHEDGITVSSNGIRPKAVNINTAPYPAFPTDLQAQLMSLCAIADGESVICENIFENRFMHVPELNRLGSKIVIQDNTAKITGVEKLVGAEVMATDLRASVSLVLAGLVANGQTTINRVYHLDRGYENLPLKLSACGAKIDRTSE